MKYNIGDCVVVQECGIHYDEAGKVGKIIARYDTRNSSNEASPSYKVHMLQDDYTLVVFEDELESTPT